MLHKDKILNKLYEKIIKISEEDPDNVEKMMLVLDEIYDRREQLGEI
jgi:hypothetical protein